MSYSKGKAQKLSTQYLMLLLLPLWACGTWVGNPRDPDKESESPKDSTEVAIEFEGDASASLADATVEVRGTNGAVQGTLTLTDARLVLREIRLKGKSGGGDDENEFEGPYIVDLLTNKATPEPETIKVASGSYTEIELKLHKLEDDDADGLSEDDPLIKNSIYMEGQYTPSAGGSAQSVAMTFDFGEEFRIPAASSEVEIEAGVVNSIAIAFKLNEWFNFKSFDEDFSDLGDGSIVLDKDSEDAASKVREHIKENVKDSADFRKDESDKGSDDDD